MHDTDNVIPSNVRRIVDSQHPSATLREAIYDLAITGEEFTWLDIWQRLAEPRPLGSKVSAALRTAVASGIIVATGKTRRVSRPLSPEEYRKGMTPHQRNSTPIFQGAPSMRRP